MTRAIGGGGNNTLILALGWRCSLSLGHRIDIANLGVRKLRTALGCQLTRLFLGTAGLLVLLREKIRFIRRFIGLMSRQSHFDSLHMRWRFGQLGADTEDNENVEH